MHQLLESRQQPCFRYALGQELPAIPGPAWRTYIQARLAT